MRHNLSAIRLLLREFPFWHGLVPNSVIDNLYIFLIQCIVLSRSSPSLSLSGRTSRSPESPAKISITSSSESRPPATDLFAVACNNAGGHVPLATFKREPLISAFATLTGELRVLTEIGRYRRTLSPFVAILTQNRARNSFVCRTYKKQGAGMPPCGKRRVTRNTSPNSPSRKYHLRPSRRSPAERVIHRI